MVKLYDANEEVIADVPYNNCLDYWNGRDYTNGGTGRHLGFGQLDDGRFYLIHGTQWQGENDYAEIVSADRIVKEAIKSDNIDELNAFPELVELYEEKYDKTQIDKKSKTFSIRVNINEEEEAIEKKIAEMREKIQAFQNIF